MHGIFPRDSLYGMISLFFPKYRFLDFCQNAEKLNLFSCLGQHLRQIEHCGLDVNRNYHHYEEKEMKSQERDRMKVFRDEIFFADSTYLADPLDCEHPHDYVLKSFKLSPLLYGFQALADGVPSLCVQCYILFL